jgi:hypothetical protein
MRISKEYVEKNITLAVIGFNSRNEIDRCVSPFIGHVDNIILGDGAFDFYPSEQRYSTDGWMEFIEDKYGDQVKVRTYQLSGKQIDKRQKYMDIAGNLGTDFLIVMDTDDYIMGNYTDWDRFFSNLIRISDIVKDKVFMMWEWIPDESLWSKQGNQFASNAWRRSARIFKEPADMRFCLDTHYMWCPKTVTDEELLDWQLKYRDADNPKQYVGRIPIEGVRIGMDRMLRTDDQIKNGAYWAFMNQNAENSRQYYKIAKLQGTPPPKGYKTWQEFENAPHTFNEDGVRVELNPT